MSNRPIETVLSQPALKLSARGAKEGEFAKFGWQYAFGSIQATFFSGAKEGSNETRYFNIKIRPEQVQMFCNALMDATTPGPYKGWVAGYTAGKIGDKKLAGTIRIGKDEDGTIWTTIHKEGFHKAKFYLTLPPGERISYLDGTELTRAEISALRARSYGETLARTALMVFGENFDPNEGSQFGKPRGSGSEGANGGVTDDDVSGSGW